MTSSAYSTAQFWDKRYQSTDIVFDWYVEFPELQYAFQNLYSFPKTSSVLMIGCGNSLLSEQMFDAGYTNITNIDISPIVISQMEKHMQDKNKQMKWLVMDATNLQFKQQQFDVIIDKGTLDALICGSDLTLSDKMLSEMGRVIKRNGHIYIITHSGPEGRKRVFQDGLSFKSYDYFFSKIYLSNSNILVNLLKANRMNTNQEQTDKQIMTKSMLQYSLLMMKKKKTKPQKLQILWSQFGIQKVINQVKNNPNNQSKIKQQVQQQKQTTNEQRQKTLQLKQTNNQKQQGQFIESSEKKKIVFKKVGQLNPKQPYCFLYYITPKQYLDLNLKNQLAIPQSTYTFNSNSNDFVLIETQQFKSAILAIKYLQEKKVLLPNIILSSKSIDQPSQNSLKFKYNIHENNQRSNILISMRSRIVFSVTLPNSNPIGIGKQQFDFIDKLTKQLILTTQSNFKNSINPKQYQKITLLAKNSKQRINQIVTTIWNTEVIISSLAIKQSNIQIQGHVYLPPVAQQKDYTSIQNVFKGFEIKQFNRGYFSSTSNEFLSTISSMCRSHGQITIEKLWLSYYEQQFNYKNNGLDAIMTLSQNVAPYVLIHILKNYKNLIKK